MKILTFQGVYYFKVTDLEKGAFSRTMVAQGPCSSIAVG